MILFTTKTWAGDYRKFLSNAYQNKLDSLGNYPFTEHWLLVNNGVPEEVLPLLAQNLNPWRNPIYGATHHHVTSQVN